MGFDKVGQGWDIPIVLTAKLDDKRRVTMPPKWSPKTAITIQELGEDCLLVRRVREEKDIKVVVFKGSMALPEDPEWDKEASALARYVWDKLPEPEP